ncbi:MAG: CHAT domain-containing protein [Chlorobi bacterium]|nr:CHAT domain-containing protein [Chlorobiota bacterium]
MKACEHREISEMDWNEFEDRLRSAAEPLRAEAGADRTLLDYFGKEEYGYLQKLAGHARSVRANVQVSGNIVLIPGIMGSNLVTVKQGGERGLLWIDLLRLATGRISRMRLSPDGAHDTDAEYTVTPSDINKRSYARAVLWLRASWNVETFAYDWRKDIDAAADALAVFLQQRFPRQPVHLVAHSMGGLVCRNFIVRHAEQWNSMQGKDGTAGGRLVMLGTPNYGSFLIPQVLTGEDLTVRLLAAADITHTLQDILGVICTFPGCYQMLPAQGKLSAALQTLYRPDSWGSGQVSDLHLGRALKFHAAMERPESIDPERMICIAGCNRETPCDMTINAPGDFDYLVTYEGDGCVPHALGLLPNVPVYYIDESHGDLLRNEKVLNAVSDLLVCGRTSVLSDKPILSRVAGHALYQRRSPGRDQAITAGIRAIAERAGAGTCAPGEIAFAEETIMRSVMGRYRTGTPPRNEAARHEPLSPAKIELAIQLVHDDVTRVKSPAVVIGHYRGVDPVNAEGAVDAAMNRMITLANEQGIIGGGLGELFFIPVTGKQIAASSVILAGMGEEGHFTKDDLRYLMTNVTLSVSALGMDSFAMVVIGSGQGSISKERALASIIEGVSDGLRRFSAENRSVRKLVFVERDGQQYDIIREIIEKKFLEKQDILFPCLALKASFPGPRRKDRPAGRQKGAMRPEPESRKLRGTRITIERSSTEDHETFRFSALSNSAVIPVREVEVQRFFLKGASERLMTSATLEEQSGYGHLLASYLFPQDFRALVDQEESLTLILDRSTASYPWEMACFRRARQQTFLGTGRKLTRQFRTILSSPGLMPPLNRSLKALVIADPAPEREFQLDGARREGRAVAEVLRSFSSELEITVHERIGAAACDPVEILSLLFSEEYDLVHYAGHGVFDEKSPVRSGWFFSRECILSPREIFQLRRVPRLVFANACFSAVVKERPAMGLDEGNRGLAGLAEAFFERGVQNYIGAGWPVDDEPAAAFAREFYRHALSGKPLGEALAAARECIQDKGPTWGAYQHYGQADASLVRPAS